MRFVARVLWSSHLTRAPGARHFSLFEDLCAERATGTWFRTPARPLPSIRLRVDPTTATSRFPGLRWAGVLTLGRLALPARRQAASGRVATPGDSPGIP